VYHDGVAYIFPSNTKVGVKNNKTIGNWRSISHQAFATEEPVEKSVFTLWIDHGTKPVDAQYSYIVVPNIKPDAIAGYKEKASVNILSNTSSMQAVKQVALNLTEVVFYQPGKIEISKDVTVSVDQPCILIAKMYGRLIDRLSVADPTHKLRTLKVDISVKVEGSGSNWQSHWNADSKVTTINVDLPTEGMAGQSVVMQMKL
jgi:chondroitin AC lyase